MSSQFPPPRANGCLNEDADQDVQEPIAICGLSLKFPQDASSEEGFWNMLTSKRSAMSEFPRDRLNIDAFYHPTRPNSLRTRGAHFIKEDLALFDADFFSITPTEAAAMDPQQRLLLETTFHALESAGIPLEHVRGSRSSVHTGCFSNDYLQQLLKDSERLPPYAAVGASQSMLANRLSWFFNLHGPSVNLDSACSSSAMAVDLSCQMLLRGVTDMGIVAGCNLLLDPDYSTILSNMHMLSPDGRCHTFDHRANGYSRGEGVAVVVLKRLSDALRDNDSIRAIVRASGTNQDGRTPGITQPDANAQARLIRETYRQAGLSMRHTRFFEAHGTGTEIGDPIEVSAIADCFGEHRDPSNPLYVGSVKTNIGHLEGASGIAGLIKAALAVESGVIPPNTHFESINRKLASYDHVISLPLECISWPESDIRRASVNSFGYGGSNCHIVVDDVGSYLQRKSLATRHRTTVFAREYYQDGSRTYDSDSGISCQSSSRSEKLRSTPAELSSPKILTWSASTEATVQAMVTAWQRYSMEIPDLTDPTLVANIAYTLDSRRSSLPSKSFAVVSTASDLLELEQIASKPTSKAKEAPRLAFAFTGQGAQWYAMGRELFTYPVFAEAIEKSENILAALGCSWSIKDELFKNERDSMIDHPSIAQTLTTVVQTGLVDLLASFNVVPVAVVGHSMGEIAAAYCAKFLTRESALRLTYYRGLFTSQIPEKSTITGAMLAVALSTEKLEPYLEKACSGSDRVPGDLVISCVNSPANTTVSGEASRITQLERLLVSEGIFARRLRVPVAYHSPQMEHIVSDCLDHFGHLEPAEDISGIKMISSVTGSILSSARAREGSYWVANLLSPVLFSQAMTRLFKDPVRPLRKKLDGSHRDVVAVDHIIEIGPHAALRLPIQEIFEAIPRQGQIKYLSALYRKQSASVTLLKLLGDLHCRGVPVNLRLANDPYPYPRESRISLVDAPKYPFDHSKRYWSESPLVRNYRLRPHGHIELLGAPSRDWNPLEPQWRCCVQLSDIPWVLEHQLNGRAIYPASAMIAMALQGISQLGTGSKSVLGYTLRNVRYESAIAVSSDTKDLETRLQLRPSKRNGRTQNDLWNFSVFSVTADHWNECCHGTVQVHLASESEEEDMAQRSQYYREKFGAGTVDGQQTFDSPEIYSNFNKHGFYYGPAFQGISTIRHNGRDEVSAKLSLNNPLEASLSSSSYVIHPATLDSFMQAALTALSGGNKNIPTQAITHIKKIWISAEGLRPSNDSLHVSAKFEEETLRTKLYSAYALSDDKAYARVVMDGLETTVVSSAETTTNDDENEQFWYTIESAVDVDTLSGSQVLARLDSTCGHNPPGPSTFFHDLRSYLHLKVRYLESQIGATQIDPAKPYLQRYVDWMHWQLTLMPPIPTGTDDKILRNRLESEGFLGKFFLKVADRALDVLMGGFDMMELLFGEDNLVKSFYEQQLSDSLYYRKLQSYLEEYSFKHPGLNLLEVGAGTGSFTEHILNAISSNANGAKERFGSYCYTDVSPAFFDKARERFSSHANKMSFAVLNVDQDPLTQGFEANAVDVITASNVLHVTKNLDLTLQGMRKLLKPGGKLLLHEYVRPETVEVGFVFGLLPGWWPSDANDSRAMSPLLSEDMWDTLLRRNGFSGADFVLRDFADDESHLMSIMCATAIDVELDAAPVPITIAIESSSIAQQEMASLLLSRLSSEGFGETRIADLSGTCGYDASLGVVVALFDLDSAILSRVNKEKFESLKRLMLSASKTLWVSEGGGQSADPNYGMIDGFAKVFRIENVNSKLATLALERGSKSSTDDTGLIVTALRQLVRSSGVDHPEDYSVRDGILNLNRIYENTQLRKMLTDKLSGERQVKKKLADTKPFAVTIQPSRDVQMLRITEDHSYPVDLGPEEVEIEVHAVGLNSIDFSVMSSKTTGMTTGRDCAGIVTRAGIHCPYTRGDRVCAYGTNMLNSTSRTTKNLVASIADSISFEEASIIPQDYLIAKHVAEEATVHQPKTIVVRGSHTRLSKATLHILQNYPLELFVVVSTKEEDVALKSIFPCIQSCWNATFPECFRASYPAGASVVLDFLNTNTIQLTECIAKFGLILSVKANPDIDAEVFNSLDIPATVGFKRIDVAEVLQHRLEYLQMPNREILEASIFRKRFQQPLSKSMSLSALATATESWKDHGTDGRIAVKYDDNDEIPMYRSSLKSHLFDSSSSYVIAGGLGDLGRCVANWMADCGARNLILLSRSGPRAESAKATIRRLESVGVTVRTPLCDIADGASLEAELQNCQDMPAIKGCIQATGALKDIMYQNMSFEDWRVAVDPKVKGSWNLHELLPKSMDFFVLTSSITGIMGQATQINYAAGNTYQDALAKYRLSIGEKAVSLDLGILLTGGLLSQNQGLSERLAAEGIYTTLSEAEILALFELVCDSHHDMGHLAPQIVSGIVNPALKDHQADSFPLALLHPFWRQTLSQTHNSQQSDEDNKNTTDVLPSLKQAESPAEMSEIVANALADQFCRMALMARSKVNLEEPLHTAGVDSLSAVYLRNWIMKLFGVDIAVFDILGDMSIAALGAIIAKEWHVVQGR